MDFGIRITAALVAAACMESRPRTAPATDDAGDDDAPSLAAWPLAQWDERAGTERQETA
ncbi:MAG: hypothetical protein ACHP7E_00110 [Burkholderiales bacterium]